MGSIVILTPFWSSRLIGIGVFSSNRIATILEPLTTKLPSLGSFNLMLPKSTTIYFGVIRTDLITDPRGPEAGSATDPRLAPGSGDPRGLGTVGFTP